MIHKKHLMAAAALIACAPALAQIYRSSALPDIYNRWFGTLGAPGPVLETMFGLGRLPE